MYSNDWLTIYLKNILLNSTGNFFAEILIELYQFSKELLHMLIKYVYRLSKVHNLFVYIRLSFSL